MQKTSWPESLSLQKGTWQKYPLHSLFFVFKSQSLAIVIRGETETRGFVNNWHSKWVSLYGDVMCLAPSNMFSCCSVGFPLTSTCLSGAVLCSHYYYTHSLWHLSSRHPSLQPHPQFLLPAMVTFFFFSLERERERRCISQHTFMLH